MRDTSLLEDALQPQRRHLDRLGGGRARHDVAGAEIVAVGFDQEFAVGRAGGGRDQSHLAGAGSCVVEGEPRMGDRMRLDRDYLAAGADMPRQSQRVGADIGADIDEDPARGHTRAQKVQLLDVVVGIEQRAALGGAGLVVEAERGALILHVNGACAQQIYQPRQPGAKCAALQPRAVGQRNDRGLCGIRGECAERRGRRVVVGRQTCVLDKSGACIAGFVRETGSIAVRVRSTRRSSYPAKRSTQYAAAYPRHCEQSEAIHSAANGEVDRFAALAMTAGWIVQTI